MNKGAIVFLIIIILVALLIFRFRSLDKDDLFRRLGKKTGLDFSTRPYFIIFRRPRLDGTFNGYRITILNKTKYSLNGDGLNILPGTEIHIPHTTGCDFTVSRETLLSRAIKWVRLDDVRTGHPQLDKKFFFTCSDPQHFKRAFDEETCVKALKTADAFRGEIYSRNGQLLYIYPDHVNTVEKMDDFTRTIGFILLVLNRLKETA